MRLRVTPGAGRILAPMSDRSRRPPTAAVAVAAVALLLAGCTGADPAPETDPTDPGTPLASYDTTEVALARAPYCDRVDPGAIAAALGEVAQRTSSHDNGEPLRLADGTRDVAHEYGCSWSVGRATARTWLFAPPITADRARALVSEARSAPGCEADAQAPAFGTPSLALVCTDDGRVAASYRGLFGDAWLVCELTARGDREDVVRRAGRWCVAVATAASA